MTLHDLFPCGKAGRRGLWRLVQERLEKDPDFISEGKYLFCYAHIEANVKEMVIQSVTQAAQNNNNNNNEKFIMRLFHANMIKST